MAAMVFLVLMSGCSASLAPVVDIYGQDSRQRKVTSGTHQVREGETLYSIAWRYGWDYRELGAANNIPAPYTIFPGQRISLALKPAASGSVSKPKPVAGSSSGSGSASSKPVSKPAPVAKPTSSKPAVSSGSGARTVGPVTWRWPASGTVVEPFSASSSGRKGIAISGRAKSPVIAAADGRVVYRGSGLTGYGNLLILKHNDRWLSAYAHNDSMLVKEGDVVKSGQKIATMGATGTYRTQLHFEIRRDGKPVDPMQYLPRQ
ncbi:peptidoglycan DD-metalloendopeptidase family protein [Alcanivorax sp. DP30]|uniref:peptidoglycan DD-metalloendopeptidase family protein n=1 Tax=Alcanivorax sp. DP30 TaxID=2606217 RepID=UPI001926EB47|nr:peptidoglycan DD-metalloendopeptidase family protein [Alcanivorax sp. DP30]